MAIELNQNVSTVVHVGPLVEPVSATEFSTFTLAAADAAVWQPFSNAPEYDISGYTISASLVASGFYEIHLSAGTLSILGNHQLRLTDESAILPYKESFQVVHSGYWNAKFGTSALNATSIWNEATRTLTGNTNLNDPALLSIVSAVWSAALADYTTVSTTGANLLSLTSMLHSIMGDTFDESTDSLEAIRNALDVVDTTADAILVDTGTDGVAIAAGAIDTGQFAAGAIDAAALAADAGTEIANAVWATVLETEGSVTAQQIQQVTLATVAGATLSATSGLQYLTPNSAAVRVSVPSIVSGLRSSITLTYA